MKKNLIIVVLVLCVVFLFGAYSNACKERNELQSEKSKLEMEVLDYGQYLYYQLGYVSEREQLVPNTRSLCTNLNCVHADVNGNLWVTVYK